MSNVFQLVLARKTRSVRHQITDITADIGVVNSGGGRVELGLQVSPKLGH